MNHDIAGFGDILKMYMDGRENIWTKFLFYVT